MRVVQTRRSLAVIVTPDESIHTRRSFAVIVTPDEIAQKPPVMSRHTNAGYELPRSRRSRAVVVPPDVTTFPQVPPDESHPNAAAVVAAPDAR
ncbi:Hypothetical protein NTJ_02704 [Nesidiocoris tenuis]|uniref:Uncharacterized protein n=1 Tax=Nesidiocoris tenuis TaxID=355587 RepID=A0ABN7AF89_9HEMI|nr:Hypothetical protein NTJ_02704 [Nesidiocoris tenuis]